MTSICFFFFKSRYLWSELIYWHFELSQNFWRSFCCWTTFFRVFHLRIFIFLSINEQTSISKASNWMIACKMIDYFELSYLQLMIKKIRFMERKHLLILTYTKISHLIILIWYSRFDHLFNFFPADFFSLSQRALC